MNALRRWLYRGALSCVICFLIALTLYNRRNHVSFIYHQHQVWNSHSEDTHSEDKHSENCYSEYKHNISIGVLIPSTTKYIDVPDP